MGVFDNLTTQQKAIFGIGGGAALLFLFMKGSGKKAGAAGGALAVVDVRRPTDDINAPAGVGAGPGGAGRWSQVLNVNPLWGQDPMGWGRPGPGGGSTSPPPKAGASIPATRQPNGLARFVGRKAAQYERRADQPGTPAREARNYRRTAAGMMDRIADFRDPKAREGSRPVMPNGPPVEDIAQARPSGRGIHGSIINGNLDYLQQGNIPIYGSIMDMGP